MIDAVLIAGPTASGKSRAALELAHRLGGVVINTDSMQVYREARILTARPTEEDLVIAPHLLYGHVSVADPYSVGRYQTDAGHALKEAHSAGRLPVFAGGSGLYFDVLLNGIAQIPHVPASIRDAATRRREELGEAAFYDELLSRDPAADDLRPGDTQRVLRAWEVLEATGQPLRVWQAEAGAPLLEGLAVAKFVLEVPREELRARIDRRFDAMLEAGAMEEALSLRDLDPGLPAAKIIGRRELIAAHDGQMPLAEARTLAVTASRQYAKRQETWFNNRMIDWIRIAAQDFGNIVPEIARRIAE